MIIPVRCWSCGKPVGQSWDEFQERVKKGESKKEILDAMGHDRYCCRATLLGHVDLIDLAGQFKKS